MPDEEQPKDPAQTADTEDGGWSVESHSAPALLTPADTTAEVLAADDAAAAAAAGDDDPDAVLEDAGATATGQPKAAAGTKPVPGKKKKKDPQTRIDAVTRNWRTEQTARERVERDNEDLRRRLEALERGGKPAAPAPGPAAGKDGTPAAADAAPTMPEPPRYLDFQTEDEYQAAYKKWQTVDVAAWQAARDGRLRGEFETAIDARLSKRDRESAAQAHDRTVASRFEQMREAHPDFHEHVQANADVLEGIQSVFLQDVIVNTDDGGEVLYDIVSDPDLALALGELPLPTRPLADAVKSSPACRSLMRYFASAEGRTVFDKLRRLPPTRVAAEVGKLELTLEAADRGSARGVKDTITSAIPPAKPPVGTPRARSGPASPPGAPSDSFDDWMAAEDRREAEERTARVRSMGISA